MASPDNLQYTTDHEWVDDADPARVGITAHAAEQLGDIVFVSVSEPGIVLAAGEVFGEIESTKSVSELFAPVAGTLAAANQDVLDNPALINADPYANWIAAFEVAERPETLLSAPDYDALEN